MSAPPTMFAGDGEPCSSCGAPLAADQRYCLTCGHRRAAARLPFLDILRGEETELRPLPRTIAGAAPAATIGGPVPPDGTLFGQARANTGLIAGVGVLLLAMLIGVLIGSGMGDDNVSNAADRKPVVVSVGGVAAAPAAAAATTTDEATVTTPATKKKTSSSSSKSSGSDAKAAIKVKKVAPAALKNLDKLSGKEYQKQVDKLGKNIATGGAAPPKDNKPAAGGGSFEDIG